MRWGLQSLVLVFVAGCANDQRGDNPFVPELPPPDPWGAPVTGGTMLITKAGTQAVVADPDRDRIVVVDLASGTVAHELALDPGTMPGRLVEDGAGRIHVALRGRGELLSFVPGTEPARRAICGEPRGVAWDPTGDLVHVACSTGELVSVPAAGGAAVRTVMLQRDLRDVLVQPTGLVVTTFRTAELIKLDAAGVEVSRARPPNVKRLDLPPICAAPPCILVAEDDGKVDAIAEVAWRTIAMPDGSLVMLHQRKLDVDLDTSGPGYSGDCSGPVDSALTVVRPGALPVAVMPFVDGALPVDIAVHPDGQTLAAIAAGNRTVTVFSTSLLTTPDDDECGDFDPAAVTTLNDAAGIPTSVAYSPAGDLVTYYPEPAVLAIRTGPTVRTVQLSGELHFDTGRALFHQETAVGIACASCHPEGREDGQTWRFTSLGPRRTQSLAGGILSRAPYHWGGDMRDLPTLMDDVFTNRMFGGEITASAKQSLGPWLDRIAPAPGTVRDAASRARGETVFAAECARCHSGPLFTNNELVDVGTGAPLKVPSLVGLSARAPFIHNGCAPTLADRFGPCGGGDKHGKTSQLTQAQVADLVAYLEAL